MIFEMKIFNMSEIEEIKLVFGILLSIGGAVLLCVSMVLSKYVDMDKKCKGKTTGIVRGYSQIGSNGGVRLPKVEYKVDGKQYFVVGPQYKATVVTSIWTPNSVNDMTYYEDENHVLHVKRELNSHVKISFNPMAYTRDVSFTKVITSFDIAGNTLFIT